MSGPPRPVALFANGATKAALLPPLERPIQDRFPFLAIISGGEWQGSATMPGLPVNSERQGPGRVAEARALPGAAPPATSSPHAHTDACPTPNAEPTEPTVGPRSSEERARLQRMFDSYHTMVWRAVRRLGADADEASDVTQQAFLIAAERLADIRPESERAYLFATAIRLAQTRHRRARRTVEFDIETLSAAYGSEDAAARKHYAQQLLERTLSQIDGDLVTVFTLFELEGLSSQDISEALEIPVGTVASRLRRAREQFRAAATKLEKRVQRASQSGDNGGKGSDNEVSS